MLVLARKPQAGNQSVLTIGPDVEVTVLEIQGDQVRLGITAPQETAVHRKEVWMQLYPQAAQETR